MSYGERDNWTIGKVLALPVTVPFTVFLMTVVIGQAFYSAVIQPWQFRLMPKRRIPFYSNSWRMSSDGMISVGNKKHPSFSMFLDFVKRNRLKGMNHHDVVAALGRTNDIELDFMVGQGCVRAWGAQGRLVFAGGPVWPYERTMITIELKDGKVSDYYLQVPAASFGTGYLERLEIHP